MSLAGEKIFVHFAGRTAEVVDINTGEGVPVQIFIAVLDAPSFTYARSGMEPESCRNWIAAHDPRPSPIFGGAARRRQRLN